MITNVKDVSPDEFDKRLKFVCIFDDGEQRIENSYVVREITVVKRGKEVREVVANCVSSPACNIIITENGEVNPYVKNDVKDCIRVFKNIVLDSKWVEP